jgi:Protein of unknown function (DUF2281)
MMSPSLEHVLAAVDQLDLQDQLTVISHLIKRWQQTPNRLPTASFSRKDLFGCLRGQIFMADDFNAPLNDFAEYI